MSYTTREARLHFGNAVTLVREQRGLSQVELASRMGADQSWIAMIEQGKTSPRAIDVEDIAKALEIPVNILGLIAADKSKLEGAERSIAEKLTELALDLLRRDEA